MLEGWSAGWRPLVQKHATRSASSAPGLHSRYVTRPSVGVRGERSSSIREGGRAVLGLALRRLMAGGGEIALLPMSRDTTEARSPVAAIKR